MSDDRIIGVSSVSIMGMAMGGAMFRFAGLADRVHGRLHDG
jgi:hypothetical protein